MLRLGSPAAALVAALAVGLAAVLVVASVGRRDRDAGPDAEPDTPRAPSAPAAPGALAPGRGNADAGGGPRGPARRGPGGPGPVAVRGALVDLDGAPLAGATVTAVGTEPPLVATTGADGGFELDPAARGRPLRVEVPGGATFSVAADATARIVGSRTATFPIAGRVVDDATGAPVAEVTVRASPAAVPAADTPWWTRTDADGRFTLAVERPGPYVLDVAEAGSGADARATRLERVEAGRRDVEVRVVRGLAVEGRLVGPDGATWHGAVVVEVEGRSAPGVPDFTRRGRGQGADGRFRVGGLAPGRYDVRVTPSAPAPGEPVAGIAVVRGVDAGAGPIDVVLPLGVALEVRLVTPDGAPLDAAGVVLARIEGGELLQSVPFFGAAATGRAAGAPTSVELGPLDLTGRYDLAATAVGHDLARRRDVAPGDGPVTLALRPAARIAGRVVTATGEPAPGGVDVGAFAEDGDPTRPGARGSTTTAKDGTFVLDGLVGTTFVVEGGGGATGYLGTPRRGVAAGTTDLELPVEEGVELAGRLVDARGEPVSVPNLQGDDGARLAAKRPYTHVGPDGRFRLRGLRPGRVALSARVGETWVHLGVARAPGEAAQLVLPGP